MAFVVGIGCPRGFSGADCFRGLLGLRVFGMVLDLSGFMAALTSTASFPTRGASLGVTGIAEVV